MKYEVFDKSDISAKENSKKCILLIFCTFIWNDDSKFSCVKIKKVTFNRLLLNQCLLINDTNRIIIR